jgi:Tol biopolymer transport system component
LLVLLPLPRADAQARVVGDVANLVPDTLTLSPDGQRFAAVVADPRTGQRRVIVDGKPMGKPYDSIAVGMPIFSFDGRRVAYVARAGRRCHVVLDGVESEGYLLARDGWPIADLVFSPHSKYLAFKARVEGRTAVVVHGEPHGPYEVSIDVDGNRIWNVWDFRFSADGEYFAYRARGEGKMVLCTGKVLPDPGRKDRRLMTSPAYDSIGRGTPIPLPGLGPQAFGFIAVRDGKEFTVVWNGKDWIQGPSHDAIARDRIVCPPPASRRLDYLVPKDGKWTAVIDGKEGPPYDEIGTLMYSADGRHAYAARKGEDTVVVVQGVESPAYEGVRYPHTIFSPDGKSFAYAARTSGVTFVVVDGRPGLDYRQVEGRSLTFSADSKSFAFAAARGDQWLVVRDGKPGPEFDQVFELRYSADGARLGYRARRGLDHFLVVDDRTLGPFADLSPDSPMFSPDGKQVAYAALNQGQWQVYVDDKAHPPCDGIASRLAFSSDGLNHLAYVGRFRNEDQVAHAVVTDGRVGKTYDTIWLGEGGRLFLDPMAPAYFATKGPLVYREPIVWPEKGE